MEKTVAVSLYPIFSFFLFFEKKKRRPWRYSMIHFLDRPYELSSPAWFRIRSSLEHRDKHEGSNGRTHCHAARGSNADR